MMAIKPRLIRKKIEVWGDVLVWSARRGEIPVDRGHLGRVVGLSNIPKKNYTVTYKIDPKGEFLVVGGSIVKGGRAALVCPIPKQWDNHRVSREVKVDDTT